MERGGKTVRDICWGCLLYTSYISYNEAKRGAKPDEHFGEGELKGIAAPESANNGATASCLIPLLTLGIPGDAVAATLMGAFTMHGLVAVSYTHLVPDDMWDLYQRLAADGYDEYVIR